MGGSGVANYTVTYIPDNNAGGLGATTTDTVGASYSLDLDPDEAVHEVTVTVFDLAGNSQTSVLRFPPVIVITAPTTVSSTTISDTTFTVQSPGGNPLSNITTDQGSVNCDGSGNGVGPFASSTSCTLTGVNLGGVVTIAANDATLGATGQAQQTT